MVTSPDVTARLPRMQFRWGLDPPGVTAVPPLWDTSSVAGSVRARHWVVVGRSQVPGGRSPLSPLSGCLYRDVIWAIESLYPMLIQCNIAEIYGV